jgi:arabinose-5-phosphate isomerase
VEMSSKGMGMTAVIDADTRVVGIFTDGDLRRSLDHVSNFSTTRIDSLMTRTPRSIGADVLAIDCIERMEQVPKVSQLLVLDADAKLIGALHLHDLFRAKVV